MSLLWANALDEEREKGIKECRQAVILNMLKEKLDVSLISKVTSLSEEEIKECRQVFILNMLKEKADLSFISKVTGLSEEEIKELKNEQ